VSCAVVLFTRDLRVRDQLALAAAARGWSFAGAIPCGKGSTTSIRLSTTRRGLPNSGVSGNQALGNQAP
jgi:hypothetical protein